MPIESKDGDEHPFEHIFAAVLGLEPVDFRLAMLGRSERRFRLSRPGQVVECLTD